MIPSEINQVFGHTGGIGIQQDFKALSDVVNDSIKGKRMSLVRENYASSALGLNEAIENTHNQMRLRKKLNKNAN